LTLVVRQLLMGPAEPIPIGTPWLTWIHADTTATTTGWLPGAIPTSVRLLDIGSPRLHWAAWPASTRSS